MKKLFKLESDIVSIKVTGRDYPEVFVYDDEFYKKPEFVGSAERVAAVLGNYFSVVLREMKKQKKQFLRLKFDFCEEDYQKLVDKEKLGVQKELFND